MSYVNWTNQEKPFNPILKDYQKRAIEILEEESPEALSSRFIWEAINDTITVSRASVINFLELLRKNGYIKSAYISGTGGMHHMYSLKDRDTSEDVITTIAVEMIMMMLEAEPYLPIKIQI